MLDVGLAAALWAEHHSHTPAQPFQVPADPSQLEPSSPC